jgi:murein DD-endopeptidase MepM/ murein hydrolase activator NlpD
MAPASGPGGALCNDLFAEALADAVAESGGMGIADLLESSLAPAPSSSKPEPGAFASLLPGQPQAPVTSSFGRRADPFAKTQVENHPGVDLAAPEGSPIAAAGSGVVIAAGPRGGYGNAVEIDHGNGLHTLYAHASAVRVHAGEQVVAGQTLADVGQTGRSTGPHLHFEARQNGRPINPAHVLKIYSTRSEE